MKLLDGKHALITGGSGGIGREIAAAFLQHDARVSILGRDQAHGQEALKELHSRCPYGQCAFYLADVASSEQVQGALEKAQKAFGSIDIGVNNAGIKRDGLLLNMSEEAWDQVLTVNLKSVFTLCKALVRSMIKKRAGSILNISSIAGLMGNPGQCNYSAAKAGVIGLTRTLAREVGKRGVRVNAICPGFVDTPMTQSLKKEMLDDIFGKIPLGRMGTSEEIAKAALFLASDWASYITGQSLIVDGGLIA